MALVTPAAAAEATTAVFPSTFFSSSSLPFVPHPHTFFLTDFHLLSSTSTPPNNVCNVWWRGHRRLLGPSDTPSDRATGFNHTFVNQMTFATMSLQHVQDQKARAPIDSKKLWYVETRVTLRVCATLKNTLGCVHERPCCTSRVGWRCSLANRSESGFCSIPPYPTSIPQAQSSLAGSPRLLCLPLASASASASASAFVCAPPYLRIVRDTVTMQARTGGDGRRCSKESDSA